MNQCPRCAAPVQPNDKFCGSCAAPIPRAPDPAPSPPAGYPGAPQPYPQAPQPGFAPPAYNQPYPQQPAAAAPGFAPAAGFAPPQAAGFPSQQVGFAPPQQGGFAPPQQGGFAPPQPAPTARCEHGHDVSPGANYCPFGHPIALGDMQFTGGDAFGPTAFGPEGGSPIQQPSTGEMSPFPGAGQQLAAGAAGPTAAGPYDPANFGQAPAYAPPAPAYGQSQPYAPAQPFVPGQPSPFGPPPQQPFAPAPQQPFAPAPQQPYAQPYAPPAPPAPWGTSEPSPDGWGTPAPQQAQLGQPAIQAPQPVAPQPMQAPQPMGAQPAPAQGVDPGAITGPADPLGRILKGFLVSFHNQPTGTFWALYTAKNAIGRAQSGEALDIEINDPTTSSRHAQITFDSPRGPLLEDLGSTNGTFLNEQPIGYQGSVELHDGDRIRFGGYNTVVRLVSNQS